MFVRVRRMSDGFYLDFSDNTFKSVGWTTLNAALGELDPVLAPGLYELAGGLDTAFVNGNTDDNLVITPIQTPGSDAVLPLPEELKVGQWVDGAAKSADLLGATGKVVEHKDAEIGTNGHIRVPADGGEQDIPVKQVNATVVRLNEP